MSLLAVWRIAESERSWMLFYSGNSMLPALVRASWVAGDPQQWALSAVLFIPEMALYLMIAALGLGVKASFIVSAVVNFLLLFAMLRVVSVVARSRVGHFHQLAGAIVAFATFVALTLLDTSANVESLEIPSLLATTTYYSTTVLALVLGTGLCAAILVGRGSRVRLQLIALFALSTVSALSNPLYLAWVVAPITAVLFLLRICRVASSRASLRVFAPLMVGSLTGWLLRVPFASLISPGPPYADPTRGLQTFVYYLRLLMERLSSPAGVISITAIVFLTTLNLLILVRSIRHREVAFSLIAGMGCIAPVMVSIGAVMLGAISSRYLQPVFFAPLLVLVLLPGRWQPTAWTTWRHKTQLVIAAVTVLALGSTSAVLGLSAKSATLDPSIRCAVDWIDASRQTGAGRFLTVRGPKAYLQDPRQLIQVDNKFNGYAWLTNRVDFERRSVSFILTDAASAAPLLPSAAAALPFAVIDCGRYTIFDYHGDVLALGPSRSIEAR